jgi:hypothetical protein
MVLTDSWMQYNKLEWSTIREITLNLFCSRDGSLTILIFVSEYVPELERARAARDASLAATKADSMSRVMADLKVDRANPEFAARDRWDPEADEDDDDDEANIIDRCEYGSPSVDGYVNGLVRSGRDVARPIHRFNAPTSARNMAATRLRMNADPLLCCIAFGCLN